MPGSNAENPGSPYPAPLCAQPLATPHARRTARDTHLTRRAPMPLPGEAHDHNPLAPPWPLIGRTVELAGATDLLTAPGSRGVIIRGPAGAGATRLGHEVWESARKLGHPVIRAAATHASRSVALGALAPLLSPGPHGRLTLRTDRPRTAEGRGRRPPVLLLDDIHLLDDESAGLLQPLLATGEFLLIATAAPECRQESASARLAGDLNLVPLEPLSWTVVQTLLERVLDGPVERRTARQLHRVSGGRPLYLRELVSGALNGGSWCARPACGGSLLRSLRRRASWNSYGSAWRHSHHRATPCWSISPCADRIGRRSSRRTCSKRYEKPDCCVFRGKVRRRSPN